jgi:hypothetical protein
VSTCCGGLLKQGVDVLGVACCKRPTRMVGWKLGVANGGRALTPDSIALVLNWEKGDGGVTEDRQVALTELHEGLVGSSVRSVIEVVTLSHGKPSHHSRVSGVSKNVHIDLAAPQPKLMEWMATVCGSPRVAKAVQHIPEQGGKTRVVQPITREPSVDSEGGVGVVIYLSKTKEK